ncbi:MAG TPA: OB-fold domain-containing protein [Candidatus Dormibacteraeota bacterium]|nr:OB-fold domain-containing protein [Candidatus Dormibacteraeota bacterium]
MQTAPGRIANDRRPLPNPDALTQPYWDAAREGHLAIQRCTQCRTFHHPPIPFCDICDSRTLEFERVSGRGKVYTHTRMHALRIPGFEDAGAYPLVWVELDEQPLLTVVCNMDGTDPEKIRVGAPVEVTFVDAGEGVVLPDFRLTSEGA